ncbi:MAG: hypothetical protein C3F10_12225 [Dehalococcoidia bacterium]|nr:MAG: hypothetical protein C3F10_12225 [Dehalococcoidia bacterium]
MTPNGKHGSVQEMLPLEEIVEGVLCLRGGDYRAVIQAQSVNFALKSEEEQEAVMAAYRSFLNSLSHPVQMLVRILPTNVEPYLKGFRTNVTTHANSEAIRRLALDHEIFVRRLARERTLLERRFYLVVPSGREDGDGHTSLRWPWQRLSRERNEQQLAVAAAQLDARCHELSQGLTSFGVSSRRLRSEELAELWTACLCSQVSQVAPSLTAGARPVVTALRKEVEHG